MLTNLFFWSVPTALALMALLFALNLGFVNTNDYAVGLTLDV